MNYSLLGYYGFGNLGDELLLKSILIQIFEIDPLASVTVFHAAPEKRNPTLSVRFINRWSVRQVFKALGETDIFLLGGGGLFQDKTSSRSLYYYLAVLWAAFFMRCRVVLYAVGIESISNPVSRFIVKYTLKLTRTFLSVRDEESKTWLSRLGFADREILLVEDPVTSLRLDKESPSYEESATVLKPLFIPRFPCPIKGEENAVKSLSSYDVMLFHPSSEISSIKRIIPSDLKGYKLLEWKSVGEAISIIRKHEVIVSSRFHALVLAFLLGKHFIGYGDFEKVGRFCQRWGAPYFGWDTPFEEIESAIVSLMQKGDDDSESFFPRELQNPDRVLDKLLVR